MLPKIQELLKSTNTTYKNGYPGKYWLEKIKYNLVNFSSNLYDPEYHYPKNKPGYDRAFEYVLKLVFGEELEDGFDFIYVKT